nr:PREDICTED: ankyrin repeat and SOCS box protein 10-like [Apteryx mantelli mantelli]XP_013798085.1 PREDICTED: ankyrin repeat and SOCS box protein 10-like [Apteryx mantelli mantelli]XP_013798086.1 PREDICTED: ankyrin repeat and SOCS box protein 10-like [Apteryx mantelli mantelli]
MEQQLQQWFTECCSVTLCSLQLDKEKLDRWKYSRHVRPRHSEGNLNPVGRGCQNSRTEPLECRDLLVQNALFTGDLEMVQKYFTKDAAINLIIETKGDELRWTSRKFGLWSLTYEQELTTPLHITASRGYADCLRFLLLRGASVNFAPGGKTALHEACAAASTDCASLLLSFGADPEAVSEDGYKPLHLCKSPGSIECVRQLLQHGASVNSRTEEEDDTALHVAARHGLTDHVQLLLRHGAELEAKNEEGQTPLNAACAQPHQPRDVERYYRVCQLLVESGASINAADRDRQHPLHLACKNANAQVVELLLARGANVNIMNYSGNTALHNILQAAAYKPEHQPELVVRALLNYGAIRIWPGSLLKVLRYCHSCPRVLEALMNSYEHVRVSEDWVEAVPAEVVQKYPRFYQSLFSLEQSPRSLQHLARCTLRTFLEGRLLRVLSQLHLPSALHQFLLLGFEDVLY